jgi:hypothetical protein
VPRVGHAPLLDEPEASPRSTGCWPESPEPACRGAKVKAAQAAPLHLHSSFDPGGKELRAAKLMNAFGPGIEHAIVSALAAGAGRGASMTRAISVAYPADFHTLAGGPFPAGAAARLAEAMRGMISC